MAPKVARVGTVSNCIGPRLNFHGVARQTQPRAQPTLGAVLQFDRSAMAFRDRLDQREAQARTASFGTARRFQPHKWFENARAIRFRDAGAIVVDGDIIIVRCLGPVSYTHLTLP